MTKTTKLSQLVPSVNNTIDIMFDIPNTEYVTLKKGQNDKMEILVGDKPTHHYRSVKILWIDNIEDYFNNTIKLYPQISEIHILCSITPGERAKIGKPSKKHGPNEWIRIKFDNEKVGPWVFYHQFNISLNEPLEYHTKMSVHHCIRAISGNHFSIVSVAISEMYDTIPSTKLIFTPSTQPIVAQDQTKQLITEKKNDVPTIAQIVKNFATNKQNKTVIIWMIVIYQKKLFNRIKQHRIKQKNSR